MYRLWAPARTRLFPKQFGWAVANLHIVFLRVDGSGMGQTFLTS